MSKTLINENLLTGKEVCVKLNIHLTTLYRWMRAGKIRGIKVGRQWRFAPSEIMRILEEGSMDR